MKLTDFVAKYIELCRIKHVFVIQGGAALHLIDSIEKNENIKAIPTQHEQASAMAADGYAKASDAMMGCTISTSGPGATNLVTGIACSFFDSVATLHITGNVASFRQSHKLNVRQYGFQETDIVSMVKPICKYAVQIKTAEDILVELPKAITIAISGRKGPVLVDIPDDFQRVILDSDKANKVLAKGIVKEDVNLPLLDESKLQTMLTGLFNAKRPIVILGAGLTSAKSIAQAKAYCEKYDLPYLTTWPLKGISDHHERLNIGNFGTHSYRGNNVVLQNADFILSIGCRLDSKATAKPESFARSAELAMIDIEVTEIEKFEHLGLEISHAIQCDSMELFTRLFDFSIDYQKGEWLPWYEYIKNTQSKLNYIPAYELSDVNPYQAIKTISGAINNQAKVILDTGTCLPLTLVYGEEKKGQKYFTSFNNTPMGYALPSAIGVSLTNESTAPLVVIAGDGGLQMNIQELATIRHLSLPMVIVVFNNSGHAMIKQTQDDWLDSNYYAASPTFGVPQINFATVAKGYGIDATTVTRDDEFEEVFRRAINESKPYLIELAIHHAFRYEPIIKYGNPLENMSPLLDEALIEKSMIIKKYKN